jgi:hypothetical protein
MKYYIRQLNLTDIEVSENQYRDKLFEDQIIFGETLEIVRENKLILIPQKLDLKIKNIM